MLDRRDFIRVSAALIGAGIATPVFGGKSFASGNRLLERAKAALDRHGALIPHRDVIGIGDFSTASSQPRFHIVDLQNGRATSLLVAHGKGSDPAHTGWLQRFSNLAGSEATSEGSYLTEAEYVGQHGRSQRLRGLDPENDQAEARAIVLHAAWYVSPQMVAQHGKLGRSQGCFAVSEKDLSLVMSRLMPGRLIFAGKA